MTVELILPEDICIEYKWFLFEMCNQRSIPYSIGSHTLNEIILKNSNNELRIKLCGKYFQFDDDTRWNKSTIRSLNSKENINIISDCDVDQNRLLFHAQGKLFLGISVINCAIRQMTDYWILPSDKLDLYGRKRFSDSKLVELEIIDTPWIDILFDDIFEYLNIVPSRKAKSNFFLTFDLDAPSFTKSVGLMRIIRNLIGDLIFRKNITLFLHRLTEYIKTNVFGKKDFFDTIDDLIPEISHDNILKYLFVMVQCKSDFSEDPCYSLQNPQVRHVTKRFLENDFNLGLHTSMKGSNHLNEYEIEARIFDEQISLAYPKKIELNAHRAHFLHYTNALMSKLMDSGRVEFGFGYCDRSGFRLGTCREYLAFDVGRKSTSPLKIIPLTAMDVSLLEPGYMNLNNHTALEILNDYLKTIKMLKGSFVLCWHNHRLVNMDEVNILKSIISDYNDEST
ncbi:hypothetical protein N9M02_01695 [Amylibacter sp.]|nr:hypothetical protein [Amylibacter sp.]